MYLYVLLIASFGLPCVGNIFIFILAIHDDFTILKTEGMKRALYQDEADTLSNNLETFSINKFDSSKTAKSVYLKLFYNSNIDICSNL
jgi:hypothetical protein